MDLKEAARIALDSASPLAAEWIGLEDALGRVLAEELKARFDIPGQPRSRLDGFALRSEDTSSAAPDHPVLLEVLPGMLAAGNVEECSLNGGQCIRIMTGSAVPPGADAIVPQEKVRKEGNRIAVDRPFSQGHGLARRGEDIREGESLMGRGEILTPTRLALITALGISRISVYRKPKVALIATGDEVREMGEAMDGPWTICNNRFLLSWLVHIQGGCPVQLGVVKDDPRAIAARLADLQADLVITTGGMGPGDRDFVLESWNKLGVESLFTQINLSPGKKSALGIKGNQLFWGLSGNPWAARAVFVELIAPVLWRLQGLGVEKPTFPAAAASHLKNESGFHKVVRGSLDLRRPVPSFIPVTKSDESLFSTLINSFAYIILEPHVVEVAQGSSVEVHLHDFPLLARPLVDSGGSGL